MGWEKGRVGKAGGADGVGGGRGGRGGWSRWGGRRTGWERRVEPMGWEQGRVGGSRAGSWQMGEGGIGGLGVRCLGRRGDGGGMVRPILEIGFWMDGWVGFLGGYCVFWFLGHQVGIDVGWEI